MSQPRAPAVHPPGSDPHRPRWHFTAPGGATGRPAALAHAGGRWQLYYQHNPLGAAPGRQHWGRASSADLAGWRDEPLALMPSADPAGHDALGCGPGSWAVVDGLPTLYYTGDLALPADAAAGTPATRRQVQCVATSADGQSWQPQPWRSLTLPPADVPPAQFRHPFVLRLGPWWYLLVGASADGQRGQCLLYRSHNGIDWQYRHPLLVAPDAADGRMWERPNLLPMADGRWLFTTSVWPQLGALWFTGRFDDERFVPDARGTLDPDGGALGHTALGGLESPDGRTLQWAWIPEQRSRRRIEPTGWAGALSVPRTLSLDARHRLVAWPVAELHALREAPVPVLHTGAGRGVLARLAGDNLDIEARFALGGRQRAGLTLRASPDGDEATRIVWWPDARRLLVERERSSIDGRTRHQNVQGQLSLDEGEALNLRVLLDRSVLEVYANGRLTLTTRIYPLRADSLQAWAWSEGPAELALQAWTMRGIHPERPQPAEAQRPVVPATAAAVAAARRAAVGAAPAAATAATSTATPRSAAPATVAAAAGLAGAGSLAGPAPATGRPMPSGFDALESALDDDLGTLVPGESDFGDDATPDPYVG